jgi:hypothetical protein
MAPVADSGASIVETFTVSVLGDADQNFLRTPFDCAPERLASWPGGLDLDKPGHNDVLCRLSQPDKTGEQFREIRTAKLAKAAPGRGTPARAHRSSGRCLRSGDLFRQESGPRMAGRE